MASHSFQPVVLNPQRLSDLAFERLLDAILTGVLAQGEILHDAEIAAQLGISRMPVREAIHRLIRAGLVESEPSRYTRVVVITPRLAADVVEYSAYWYGTAASLAVQRMSDSQLEEAVRRIDAVDLDTDDVDRFYASLRAVFSHLAECSGNQRFAAHAPEPFYLAELATREISRDGMAKVLREEKNALREALLRRDSTAAAKVIHHAHGAQLEIGGPHRAS